MRDYDATVKNLREAAKGLLFDAMPYRASVMQDAADAIEELLDELTTIRKQLPHWISVEDELPEEVPVDDERWSISVRPSADVNIYLPSEGAIVTAFYSWADGTWITVNEDRIYYASEVSHWSKLPAPPTKGVE